MSGINEERMTEITINAAVSENSNQLSRHCDELLAEIRRLRAENKELRASYERVEKYAQDLLQEREVLAAMAPSK